MKNIELRKKHIFLLAAIVVFGIALAVSLAFFLREEADKLKEQGAFWPLLAFFVLIPVLLVLFVFAMRQRQKSLNGSKKLTYAIITAIILTAFLIVASLSIYAAGGIGGSRAEYSIGIQTQSASKVYDGEPLVCHEYQIVGGKLAEGHTLSVSVLGTRTDAGISDNTFVATITDQNGVDVTAKYAIDKEYGSLEIIKIPITISTPSYHGVYDGNSIARNEWSLVSQTQILQGHEIEVVVVGSQTDVGIGRNKIGQVIITEDGRNVTANYEITYLEGDLIVTPRKITIRSGSASKPYDGTPLRLDEWNYASTTQPITGHQATVVISGSQTVVGKSLNFVSDVLIKDGERDVTFNYDIELQEGYLTVTGDSTAPANGVGMVNDLDESGMIGGGGMLPDGSIVDSPSADVVVARVLTDVEGAVYLRYMSFGDYTGVSWTQAADYSRLIESKYSYNYLSGFALENSGNVSYAMTLKVFSNNYLLPYYLDDDDFAYQVQTSDVKHFGDTTEQYFVYYYPLNYELEGVGGLVPSELAAQEREYFDYVKRNYLALPVQTKEYLQNVILKNGLDKNSPDIIGEVARYIRNAATYNFFYNPELNTSSDIIVSFLDTYKEGICGHFASAATALYRALGIPARYCIGYAATAASGKWTNIYSINSHAWVEVYLEGVGWIQVEVSGNGASYEGDFNDNNNATTKDESVLTIKPIDIDMQYTSGAVLNATNTLQGLSELLAKGYTYTAVVTGKQTTIGIGYSTIVSFELYNPQGKNVTDEFDVLFEKGKLHLYLRQLSVTTESLSKVYDGTVLFTEADKLVYDGELINGHSFSVFKAMGRRVNVGQSQNICDIIIVDSVGNDVTYMYKINKNYGTLTVLARKIRITAGSSTKPYDGTELFCADYDIGWDDEGDALAVGDKAFVTLSGSQTELGRSPSEVDSLRIVNAKGENVTDNYSIEIINGWLIVTPS